MWDRVEGNAQRRRSRGRGLSQSRGSSEAELALRSYFKLRCQNLYMDQ